MSQDFSPTKAHDRIDTLDLLRGVAICGILLINIPQMGGHWLRLTLTLPMSWDLDRITWAAQFLLPFGAMRGLFTLLFGAALLLMVRGSENQQPEAARFDVWARRCLILMLLGVVQFAVFLWPGEILWNYGLAGLFLLAFRTMSIRNLLLSAAAFLLALSLHQAAYRYDHATTIQAGASAERAQAAGVKLTDDQQAAITLVKENREIWHPDAALIKKDYNQRTHFSSLWKWSAEQWIDYNFSVDSWFYLAESIAFMLIGMVLFKNGILTGEASISTYWKIAALGYAIGLGLRSAYLYQASTTGFDPSNTAMINPEWNAFRGATLQIARLAMTLAHLSVIIALYKSGILGRAWPVRAMGRMALTVYSLQSIITSILFYGFGFYDRFGFAQLMGISVLIWIATGWFCVWWLKSHAMGPAEVVLRRLAYGKVGQRGTAPYPAAPTAPAAF